MDEKKLHPGDESTQGIPYVLQETLGDGFVKILRPRTEREHIIAIELSGPQDYTFEDFLHKVTLRNFAWVGSEYRNSKPGTSRLLLVSESFYDAKGTLTGENPSQTLVKAMLDETGPDRWKPRPAYYTRVFRIITGKLVGTVSPEERMRFWDRVGFYHFIQKPVGVRPRERPSDQDWTNGKVTFDRVIREAAPSHVIFLGKQLWRCVVANNLVAEARDEPFSGRVTVSKQIPSIAMATQHPSAFMKNAETAEKVKTFFDGAFDWHLDSPSKENGG